MKTKDISEANDPDMRASVAALQPRQTAIQTDTHPVIVKDGRLSRHSESAY